MSAGILPRVGRDQIEANFLFFSFFFFNLDFDGDDFLPLPGAMDERCVFIVKPPLQVAFAHVLVAAGIFLLGLGGGFFGTALDGP